MKSAAMIAVAGAVLVFVCNYNPIASQMKSPETLAWIGLAMVAWGALISAFETDGGGK